jgi:hypothetical protein
MKLASILSSVEWPPREQFKEHLFAYDNLKRQWQGIRKVRNVKHFMTSVDVVDSKGTHWCLCAEYDDGKFDLAWLTPQQVYAKGYLLPIPFINWRSRK